MRLKNALVYSLLAGSIALGACDEVGTTGPNDSTSRVSLLLTDAPGDLRAAVVTISDIYLVGEGGEESGRVYLRQGEEITTNLLTLSNDVLELVDDEPIPASRYSQLRFVITGGYIELDNQTGGSTIYSTSTDYAGLPAGAQVDGKLKCPSCAQSGFKVLLKDVGSDGDSGEIDLSADQALLVDFDVSKSFGKQAGNSGMWILNPVLKATELENAATVTVTLATGAGVTLPVVGGAQLGLSAFSATLIPAAGGDPKTVPLSDADHDGVYEADFRYLVPGSYQIGFVGPLGVSFTTDQSLPYPVTVDAAGSTSNAFVLTGVTVS